MPQSIQYNKEIQARGPAWLPSLIQGQATTTLCNRCVLLKSTPLAPAASLWNDKPFTVLNDKPFTVLADILCLSDRKVRKLASSEADGFKHAT